MAARAVVPYGVGEVLTYKAHFGRIPAGTARMHVEGIEIVRGRPAYHVVFTIDGGVPLFRVHDRYDSWIDVQTLASLRHRQQISEGRYKRTTQYEIYPERGTYETGDSVYASVSQPLDDGSFIYAIRGARIRVGETRRDDRYFRPDRNPGRAHGPSPGGGARRRGSLCRHRRATVHQGQRHLLGERRCADLVQRGCASLSRC